MPVIADESRERRELQAAVDAFVEAGRTPDAFAVFAASVAFIRPRMNPEIAREAELRLVTLAVTPFESVHELSGVRRAEVLGMTVWPHLLGPSMTSSEAAMPSLLPEANEPLDRYLERLCGGLAPECARAPLDQRVRIISRLAADRALQRTKEALRSCSACSEPGWHDLQLRWEAIVRWTSSQLDEPRATK